MATATLTGIDVHLRDAVLRQLQWDPEFDASGIGVTAHEGAVTLSGFIDTYAGKLAAERSAKLVRGVRAVANELQVRLKVERADDEIARDAARALALHGSLPDTVQATVREGHVTLTGKVPWLFHKTSAEVSVRHVPGVIAVANRIEVTPLASFRDVRKRITEALHRVADLNARHVNVDVRGTTVTLTGTVSTWGQREIAERAAVSAPGITKVENLIDVAPTDL